MSIKNVTVVEKHWPSVISRCLFVEVRLILLLQGFFCHGFMYCFIIFFLQDASIDIYPNFYFL